MINKKRVLKKIINIFFTISVISLFILYFLRNQEDIRSVLNVDPVYLVSISLMMIILFFLEGIFIKIVLKAFNKDIKIHESFYVSTLSRIGNYLLPLRAGIAMRATYLKKKFSFPYSQFISTLYGYYIILFLLYSAFALSGLAYKYIATRESYIVLTLFFTGIFITMIIFSLVKIPIEKVPSTKNRAINTIIKILKKILNGWNIIISNKKTLLNLFLISLGNILLNVVIFLLEFGALGIKSSIENIILYSSLSGVSLLVSITPGSLGLREAIFMLTSQSLGISNEIIMQMALLDRGIMFALLTVLAIPVLIFPKIQNAKITKK